MVRPERRPAQCGGAGVKTWIRVDLDASATVNVAPAVETASNDEVSTPPILRVDTEHVRVSFDVMDPAVLVALRDAIDQLLASS